MRIYSDNINALYKLLDLGRVNAILIHGSNQGLASMIVDQIVKKYNFLQSDISIKSDGFHAVEQKLAESNFFGQKALVRVFDFGTTINSAHKLFLKNMRFENVACYIAGEALQGGNIKKFFEESEHLACIGCYDDDESDVHKALLRKAHLQKKEISPDALSYLKLRLKGDSQILHSELDKLMEYIGDKTIISLTDVQECITGGLYVNRDRMCIAFALKNYKDFLFELANIRMQNINEVLVIRALQRFYINLYVVLSYVKEGVTVDCAISKLSPPIFFKNISCFKRVIDNTDLIHVELILRILFMAEVEYKRAPLGFDILLFVEEHINADRVPYKDLLSYC